MKTTSLEKIVPAFFKANKPVLLAGQPGIGKTDIVESSAASIGAKLITSHPVVDDPTDYKGMPFPIKEADMAKFLPFGQLKEALDATVKTVWFFDDLGQASPMVQAAVMQLFLARKVNGHKLPDTVTLAAATNRVQDMAAVSPILEPLKSRFNAIIDVELDVQGWLAWAYRNKVSPTITSFIQFRPELLCVHKPTRNLVNSPSPRTWAKLSENERLVYTEDFTEGEIVELNSGVIGEAAAAEYAAFCALAKEAPSLEGILLNPDKAPIPTNVSILYAVCEGLGRMTKKSNYSRIKKYTERLIESGNGEFAVMMTKTARKVEPGISNSSDYIELITGPLGNLIEG